MVQKNNAGYWHMTSLTPTCARHSMPITLNVQVHKHGEGPEGDIGALFGGWGDCCSGFNFALLLCFVYAVLFADFHHVLLPERINEEL